VPDGLRRDSIAPDLIQSTYSTKDRPAIDASRHDPHIDGAFRPEWNRNGPNVLSFANQVSNHAALLADLKVFRFEAGRRVTAVLAEKIIPMNHREGFVANLVTSLLVGPGAFLGLPMSTTHVSTGAIIGLGMQRGGAVDWKRVREMILAWVVTLPAGALFGVLAYALLRCIFGMQ
jgi:hypothetical protein